MERSRLNNSVIKSFQTIEYLANKEECDLATLTQKLGFPKSTVRRILKTLQFLGYIEQDTETQKYRTSVKFVQLGQTVANQLRLLQVAYPFMIRLSEETGETVNLGILDGLEVICVDKVTSQHVLRQDQPIGGRTLAYCTAFGKAQLAFLAEGAVEDLLGKKPLAACTKKGFNTREALLEELDRTRKRGYAVDNEEFSEGVCCVGAPIFDNTGRVTGGISVAGPSLRVTKGKIPTLGKNVSETAKEISRALGYWEKT